MTTPMELWGEARKARLDSQLRGLEGAKGVLARCLEQTSPEEVGKYEECFNSRSGECTGEVQLCSRLGVALCNFHHGRLHGDIPDGGKPRPRNPYFRPGAQVRKALSDGKLLVECRCGENFFPSTFTSNDNNGAHQEFMCPNGHRMELTVAYAELEDAGKVK